MNMSTTLTGTWDMIHGDNAALRIDIYYHRKQARSHSTSKGLFTLSVRIDSSVPTCLVAGKDYIDWKSTLDLLLASKIKWFLDRINGHFTLSISANAVISLAITDIALIKLFRFLTKLSQWFQKWGCNPNWSDIMQGWHWDSRSIIYAVCKRAIKRQR